MSLMLPPVAPRLASLVRLIDTEFNEMPGMRLTEAQVRRLWNASERECEQALQFLCEEGHLVRDGSGRYCRHSSDY